MRYTFEKRANWPEEIVEGVIYLIKEVPQWAVFVCPCGCELEIALNLLPGKSPRWSVSTDNDQITLAPSIHVTQPCGAHFFIRGGEVQWCGSPPRRDLTDET
jgi:hypothetical protein